jgi:hypothetical protein
LFPYLPYSLVVDNTAVIGVFVVDILISVFIADVFIFVFIVDAFFFITLVPIPFINPQDKHIVVYPVGLAYFYHRIAAAVYGFSYFFLCSVGGNAESLAKFFLV